VRGGWRLALHRSRAASRSDSVAPAPCGPRPAPSALHVTAAA
jgi:hypothetical protein